MSRPWIVQFRDSRPFTHNQIERLCKKLDGHVKRTVSHSTKIHISHIEVDYSGSTRDGLEDALGCSDFDIIPDIYDDMIDARVEQFCASYSILVGILFGWLLKRALEMTLDNAQTLFYLATPLALVFIAIAIYNRPVQISIG